MEPARKKQQGASKMALKTTSAMTVRDVADCLNVDEKTVYRLVQRRELPGFKVAGAWRFRRAEIDRWIDASREGSGVSPRGPDRLRALIVDDDAVDRMAVRRAIREIDSPGTIEVVEVMTVAAARAALAESRWDCVVIDRHLPDGDGISLLAPDDDILHGAAVVMLTGMDDEEGARTALRQGAQDYLVKGRIDGTSLLRSLRYSIERKRFEDQRRLFEANFRGLIEHSPDATWVCRSESVIFSNPAFRRLLGYSLKDLSGLGASTLIHPEDAPLLSSPVAAPGEEDAEVPQPVFEVRLRAKSGEWVLVEAWTRSVLFDGETAALIAGRDVSRRKQLEEQVVFSSRMAAVGTMAAGVAHEINNPLAYMTSNVDYALVELLELKSDFEGSTAGQSGTASTRTVPQRIDGISDALKEAGQGASRVKYIVRDLKSLARPASDGQSVVDLRQVVEWSIGVVSNEIRHRARLVKDFKERPLVFGSEARLGQIVMNLLVNAAHAITDGDSEANEIRVTIDLASDGMASLEVKDTGCGIPPENLPRIFDPFFTTKPIGLGTGLGLAVCHGIVSTLGGTMSVQSTVGRGTAFRVLLPVGHRIETRQADIPQTIQMANRRRGRVMIIDDEKLLATALSRALSRHHEIFVFSSARDALADLEKGQTYDVILCDIMMPEMGGMDFHRELSRRSPAVAEQVIFMSGGVFAPKAQQFLESVPNLRLEKPMDMMMLIALVSDRVK